MRAGDVLSMDTSWWLALAAVVLLALVAALVDGWGRRRPEGRRTRRPGASAVRRDLVGGRAPRGQGGGRDRPCLVLAVRGRHATVAKITSKYRDERVGVIPLPSGAVGDAQGRPSFPETGEPRQVPVWDFRSRVGVVDPVLWDQVRHLAL